MPRPANGTLLMSRRLKVQLSNFSILTLMKGKGALANSSMSR